MIALIAELAAVPIEPGTTAPARSGIDIFLVIATIVAFFLVTLFPGVLMIVAAVKMKRLRAYWLAVVAGILAIILSPAGFFIGLPIGIWTLVVLSQREIHSQAFGQTTGRQLANGRGTAGRNGTTASSTMGVIGLVLCLVAIPVALLVSLLVGGTWEGWLIAIEIPLLICRALLESVSEGSGKVELLLRRSSSGVGSVAAYPLTRVRNIAVGRVPPIESVLDVSKHPGGSWIANLPKGKSNSPAIFAPPIQG